MSAAPRPAAPTRPVGLRRTRRAGDVLPAGTIVVDRTSRWGNPFTVDEIRTEHLALGVALAREEAAAIAVHRYAAWLDGAGPARRRLTRTRHGDRDWIQSHLAELVGHSLACTCRPGSPCHREVLLARAELLDRARR